MMKTSYIFLLLAVLGTLVPLYPFARFLMENGLDISLFFEQMFANHIASFFVWDVIVSTLVVAVLVFSEGRRLRMPHLWLYVVFNLTVGVSLALPAFLFARSLRLERS